MRRPTAAPIAAPTTPPTTAPVRLLPDWLPITPPTTAPAAAPVAAPCLVLRLRSSADTHEIAKATMSTRTLLLLRIIQTPPNGFGFFTIDTYRKQKGAPRSAL